MKKLLTLMLALALMCPNVSARKQKDSEKSKTEQTQKKEKTSKKKDKKGQTPQQQAPQQKPAPKPSVDRSGMFRVLSRARY